MPWVKIDDNLPHHPKIIRRGSRALAMFVAGICYAQRNLTDGFLPIEAIPSLLPDAPRRQAFDMALNMGTPLPGETAGLLEVVEGGYQIHDYHDHNPHAESVKEERRKKAEKVAAWRRRSRNVTAPVTGNINGTYPVSSVSPTPTPTPTPTEALESLLSGSGLPDPTQRDERRLRTQQAREVLAWLNAKSGKNFRDSVPTMRAIVARLASGVEAWQLKAIVSRKTRDWAGDPKMREYLRPATLFNATNCENYLGELPAETEALSD